MGKQVKIGTASEVFDDLMVPSRYKGLHGGRGSAKSHFFAESMIANAYNNKGFRAVCIREVQKSLKESAKRLLEDKITILGFGADFDVQNDRIITPGGGVIMFQGMQDHTAESIKSLEGMNVAWCEEAQTMSSKSLELLRPTIRSPGSELWFSWNPRSKFDPVDVFLRGGQPPDNAIIRQINYDKNKFFPKELEAERLLDRRIRPDRYAHIWLGEYEPQAVGAIWNMRDITEGRVSAIPNDITRILVAVDPAVSSEKHSDEHGIVVVGITEAGHGYVLEDGTTRGTPQKWAQRAIALHDFYRADGIVIEKNQGGDMCRHTINSVRQGINIIEVHASRGKHVRAEPISALYALGRVHHVGTHPQLESQMCQMTPSGYEGEGSPDRVDALVWCLTHLFPTLINKANELNRPAMAQMDYDITDYERPHHGRQATAISE